MSYRFQIDWTGGGAFVLLVPCVPTFFLRSDVASESQGPWIGQIRKRSSGHPQCGLYMLSDTARDAVRDCGMNL